MSALGLPMQLPRFDVALRDCTSDDPRTRMAACVGLAIVDASQYAEAIAALSGLLGDPVYEIRAQVIESLAGLAAVGAPVPKDTVLSCATDEAWPVRLTLIENLDMFSDAPTEAALSALSDAHPAIRSAALRLLRRIDVPCEADCVRSALRDGDADVRREAALTLGFLGDSTGQSLLADVLRGGGPMAHEAVICATRLPDAAQLAPVLREVLHRWRSGTALRALAAAALASICPDDGDAPIRDMLRGRRAQARLAALSALSQLPSRNAIPELARVASRVDREAEASAALVALTEAQRIFPDAAQPHLDELAQTLQDALRAELEALR